MLPAVAFNNNIKDILASKRWSIRRLARELNKDYGYVHRLVSNPIPDGTAIGSLKPIADVLGVSVDDLISNGGKPN